MPGAVWDNALAIDPGTRPGVYINFANTAPAPAPPNADGVIYYIGVADWGPVGVSTAITSPLQVDRYLGTDTTNVARRGVLEALNQGAKTVYYQRIAAAAAAAATLTLNDGSAAAAITVTAKYKGTFGNTLKAEVVTNVVNGSLKDLNIYEGTVKRETFTGADNDDIVAQYTALGSNYVVLAQAGTANRVPTNITATSLTGGVSGTGVVAGDYTAALTVSQDSVFRVLALDTTDPTIQASTAAYVVAQRSAGNRIKALFAAGSADSVSTIGTQLAALNSEAIMYLVSGAIKDGITRNPVEVAIPVAAAIAVQDTRSLTNYTLTGWSGLQRRFTGTEYTTLLTKGALVLSTDGSRVYIEQGINTLQVASQVAPKSTDWRKIRYIAIQDELVDRVFAKLQTDYIGKVSNDSRGRDEAVNQCQVVLDSMVQDRLLQTGLVTQADGSVRDVTPNAFLDPRYASTADRVYVALTGQAADAMEKFFLTASI